MFFHDGLFYALFCYSSLEIIPLLNILLPGTESQMYMSQCNLPWALNMNSYFGENNLRKGIKKSVCWYNINQMVVNLVESQWAF